MERARARRSARPGRSDARGMERRVAAVGGAERARPGDRMGAGRAILKDGRGQTAPMLQPVDADAAGNRAGSRILGASQTVARRGRPRTRRVGQRAQFRQMIEPRRRGGRRARR